MITKRITPHFFINQTPTNEIKRNEMMEPNKAGYPIPNCFINGEKIFGNEIAIPTYPMIHAMESNIGRFCIVAIVGNLVLGICQLSIVNCQLNQLLLIASTGSSCEAVYAGINPLIIPICIEIVIAKTILASVRSTGNGSTSALLRSSVPP